MNISQLPPKMRKIARNGKKLLYDNRREIMAVYEGAKKGKEQLDKTIKFLEEVAVEVRRENLDKAEQIYKRKFIRMGHNLRAKRFFTVGELSKFLNDKNDVIKTLDKLKRAKRVMDGVMRPLERSINIYKKASRAVGMANDAYKLLEQSKKLSSANDYRRYNLEVAKQFGSMCSIMKGISSKLPAGMSDYCNFIFTVGEKTEIMAKMVSDYTQKTLREIKGASSEWSKVHSSRTPNAYSSNSYGKMRSSGDLNKDLDALLGRP